MLIVSDWWQGSEILRPRVESDSATMNPVKFLPDSESCNLRISSGDWIRLTGIWNWKGGEATGTCWACGTGASMMARWECGSGGIAGARIGR